MQVLVDLRTARTYEWNYQTEDVKNILPLFSKSTPWAFIKFLRFSGAFIGEGRLFERNRILTIGSFYFSMFLNYNSISMRSSSESLGSARLLFVFASSVSLSVISKGLLLRDILHSIADSVAPLTYLNH